MKGIDPKRLKDIRAYCDRLMAEFVDAMVVSVERTHAHGSAIPAYATDAKRNPTSEVGRLVGVMVRTDDLSAGPYVQMVIESADGSKLFTASHAALGIPE